MSTLIIQRILETQLKALDSSIATAYENVSFVPPQPSVPYQKVFHLRANPEDPEMRGTVKRELGLMQVTLMYPQGSGAKDAMTKAEAIKATFKKSASFTSNGVTVVISGTPYVMPGAADGDRWALPVRIPYFANI